MHNDDGRKAGVEPVTLAVAPFAYEGAGGQRLKSKGYGKAIIKGLKASIDSRRAERPARALLLSFELQWAGASAPNDCESEADRNSKQHLGE
jgi:hypothetical protein